MGACRPVQPAEAGVPEAISLTPSTPTRKQSCRPLDRIPLHVFSYRISSEEQKRAEINRTGSSRGRPLPPCIAFGLVVSRSRNPDQTSPQRRRRRQPDPSHLAAGCPPNTSPMMVVRAVERFRKFSGVDQGPILLSASRNLPPVLLCYGTDIPSMPGH